MGVGPSRPGLDPGAEVHLAGREVLAGIVVTVGDVEAGGLRLAVPGRLGVGGEGECNCTYNYTTAVASR